MIIWTSGYGSINYKWKHQYWLLYTQYELNSGWKWIDNKIETVTCYIFHVSRILHFHVSFTQYFLVLCALQILNIMLGLRIRLTPLIESSSSPPSVWILSRYGKSKIQSKNFQSIARDYRQILWTDIKCCYQYIWVLCLYGHVCFV